MPAWMAALWAPSVSLSAPHLCDLGPGGSSLAFWGLLNVKGEGRASLVGGQDGGCALGSPKWVRECLEFGGLAPGSLRLTSLP